MTVFLVGAGPGDPRLVTLRAAELLRRAEVVVYDRLVEAGVLAMASPEAELVDVGKRVGDSPLRQDEINALLVARGKTNETVVRLKGGDPYVFGRGGEEAEALASAAVAYEVVPGVPSFVAVPAAAGVPLTMRGLSSAVVVVTGHDLSPGSSVAWEELARSRATLVVLMGGAQRSALAERLLGAGLLPSTPVLLVESGTTPRQRSIRTTLGALDGVAIAPPTTIVIGAVAGLSLYGYEDRPLFSWRVVVTRTEEQGGEFATALADAGATPLVFPTISIVGPDDGGAALEKAAGAVAGFDWVVFSSANAVDRFFAVLRDARDLGRARVAAIGSATAAALRAHGVVADLVPLRFLDEALLEAFPAAPGGGRVLLPRAAVAGELLPDGLRALGWQVEVVEAYRTVRPVPSVDQLAAVAGADAVTFLSSSAVTGFLEMAGAQRLPPVIVSIGPVTSRTARAAGLDVTLEAPEHTAAGVIAALARYTAGRTPSHRS
jgi:uroporphyrinogen III methyltransferase/synthase